MPRGIPAAGFRQPGGGRKPKSLKCAREGCDRPRAPKPPRGPWSQFCSQDCHYRDYRDKHVGQRYGLEPGDYERLLEEQGGCCAICKGVPDSNHGARAFHVDHDHETEKVRGLLCGKCNRMLGQARDSVETLRAGADYLERRR